MHYGFLFVLLQTVVLHFSTCTSFVTPLLHFPSRLYSTSYRVQVLPKEHRDHYEQHSASLIPSTFQHCTCLFWLLPGRLFTQLFSFLRAVVLIRLPVLLIPPSDSCWCLLITVTLMWTGWTFSCSTLQMWLIRWRGGAGVRTVTGFCVRLLRTPDKPMSASSPQGGHKCIMALRSTRSWQAQGGLWYMVDINWDKVNTINNLR